MQQVTFPSQTPRLRFSAQDMLVIRRDELRSQLNELAVRRKQLQEQRVVTAGTSARAKDLDARIDAIDTRTGQLEQQLFSVSDQITNGLTAQAPSGGTLTAPQIDAAWLARNAARDASRQGAAAAVFSVVASYILYRSIRRFFMKPKAALQENSPQMAQLQQSIDVIALEVERISEAQRYTAKLLNERGLASGEAQPLGLPQRESVGAKRS